MGAPEDSSGAPSVSAFAIGRTFTDINTPGERNGIHGISFRSPERVSVRCDGAGLGGRAHCPTIRCGRQIPEPSAPTLSRPEPRTAGRRPRMEIVDELVEGAM
jgi:hypothetical protein